MVLHTLYVSTGGADAPGSTAPGSTAALATTLVVLRFIANNIKPINEMGITIKVVKIQPEALKNQRLIASMAARGITRLPALVTPKQVYIGTRAITDLYSKNIKSMREASAPRPPPPAPREPRAPTDVDSSFNQERHGKSGGHSRGGNIDLSDDDDEMGGGGKDMMDTYRQQVARRDGSSGPPRPQTAARNHKNSPASQENRDDNVRNEDEDEIQNTISRLSRDVDRPPARGQGPQGPSRGSPARGSQGPPPARPSLGPPPRSSGAPSSGGPSSGGPSGMDDDEGPNPMDDLMEKAYMSNMEESIQEED